MAVYVDRLEEWGWVLRGKRRVSCHMFSDEVDLTELHAMAEKIGMKRDWFQDKPAAPHYDLVKSRRAAAVTLGAIEVDRRGAVHIWRNRRALLSGIATAAAPLPAPTQDDTSQSKFAFE